MLRRAHKYVDAGADAVLVHSKKKTCDEIDAFMREWKGRAPVVIVPTKYFATPTQHFRDIGVSMVIWANHNMRASINAMRGVTERIHKEQSLANVEKSIVSVEEVFRITGDHEMRAA